MITRSRFINNLVRAGLWVLLAMVVLAVRNRVVKGQDCETCPGKSSCTVKSECIRK